MLPHQYLKKRTIEQLYFQSNVGAAENFFTPPVGSEIKKAKTSSTTIPYDSSYPQQINLDGIKYPWKVVSYMTEISKFTAEDVNNASNSIIDQETGHIYGPLDTVAIGTLFATKYELQYCKLHMNDIICLNGSSSNLVTSILLDSQVFDFDDYKSLVIFKLENGCAISKALCRNAQMKIPIRIIRCTTSNSVPCYRYDGVYFVTEDYATCRDGQIAFKLCKIHLPQEVLLPPTSNEKQPLAQVNTIPIITPTMTPSSTIHSSAPSSNSFSKQNVKLLLQQLKSKNSQYQTRLGELQQEVSFIKQKMGHTQTSTTTTTSAAASSSSSAVEHSGLTSRNKSFFWEKVNAQQQQLSPTQKQSSSPNQQEEQETGKKNE